jgi:hypothetical protein
MSTTKSKLARRAVQFFLVWALFSGASAMSQSSSDSETRNAHAVRKAFSSWAAGTGSPFELLSPGATWTIVGRSVVAKTYPNREAFMREVIEPFNARMRYPLVPTVHQVLSDGDTVVVLFDAGTLARDGQPYVNTYAWFLKMRDGKIESVTAFFDSIAFNELWQRVTP